MNPLFAASQANLLWYAVPLVVVISMVYAATRHEETSAILAHALRFGLMVVGFMAAVLAVLLAVGQFGGAVLVILALIGTGCWVAKSWRTRRASARREPPRSDQRAKSK